MAKVQIELSALEYEELKRQGREQKRTPKAQAEWMLVGLLREDQQILVMGTHPRIINTLSGDPLCE